MAPDSGSESAGIFACSPVGAIPHVDPAATLLFVVNAASGATDTDKRRAVIEAALAQSGRRGEFLMCRPDELAQVAAHAAATAVDRGSAVIGVGGDGSLNTIAQAAHAAGCAMGVIPYGTFNYFARTHHIPTEPAAAARHALHARPMPVQVAAINDRVFLVNASIGAYADLLQDREAYKSRFGRSRWVAFIAACVTVLRAQRRLRLEIEVGDTVRKLRTLTLFVGNNRLQLQQFGAQPPDTMSGEPGDGSLAAVMLRPVGSLSMIGMMLHGAMGELRETAGIETFEFKRMLVKPRFMPRIRSIKVAFDGEVTRMQAPLDIRVLEKPLYLLHGGDVSDRLHRSEGGA